MSDKKMEEQFERLKKDGYNTVDNLVQLLKDSKIIEETQEAKQNAIKLFADAEAKEKIEMEQFKTVVDSLAKEQKKNLETLMAMIVDGMPKFQDALVAAAKAFEETMSKK